MKKTVMITAGVLALVAVGYIGSQLAAQGTGAAPAAASRGTRLATMNLAYVVKNYEKFKAFENEMKGNLKQFDDKLAAKRAQLEAYGKEAQGPNVTAQRKDELEKAAISLNREAEDITKDAKAYIAKKRDEQIVQLYREVQDAAQRYALSQGIDLVMHYTDATTQADYYNPVNVARKMQSPGCMPLYAAQGTDISTEVVMALNTAFSGHSGVTPPSGATTTTQRQ